MFLYYFVLGLSFRIVIVEYYLSKNNICIISIYVLLDSFQTKSFF